MIDIDDDLFGAVRIAADLTRGRVLVTGDALPEAVLTRTGDAPRRRGIPIGTRDAAALALVVAGAPAELRPSRGGLTRRSYRVRVRLGDTDLLCTPSSPGTARLVRGRRYDGHNEMGTFERVDGEPVAAVWTEDVTVLGRVAARHLTPGPAEATVGYALVTAFGAGAQIALAALFEGAGSVDPL